MSDKSQPPKPIAPLNLEIRTKQGDRRAIVISFIIPAVLVIALLFLLVSIRGNLEAAMANLSQLLPVGYAFAAGMVASVNPCGVLMLPSYVFHQLGSNEEGHSVTRRVLKGLLVAAVATAGFVVIFAFAGFVIAAGGRWLIIIFPYAGLLIGVAMMGLGVWLLATRRTLGILAAGRVTVSPQRTLGNMFLFGIAYAVGSLSCTLPIFLVVVGGGLASENWLVSFGQFIGYALGMGAVLVAVTLGTVLFRHATLGWMQRLTPHVHRLGAMFLMGAGAYLIYYWVFQAGLVF
jgi:cytochrome c biogenesis protein CcdA